ncbi:Lsr2 protein [Arthrobacter crystallopoietes BAB-32]|uniref:Lsr2 protein n=1 Tax=Arthrobacter crystallopoietes BAB-32 TaxID=1246476 RepID=N1V2F8_9MICC|nr:Lsr2 family protein [Arthrobacter crystallopoietes]EMY34184.1 Lsr2 protein [Arthrobacter crystallopoietes BAB-32]
MAQEVKVILVDDLDGGSADETVRFSLDANNFEIDLSADHAQQLRDALQPFVAKARKAQPRGAKSKSAPAVRTQDASAVRAWARENGYTVSDRGRVQSEILEAYRRAHGG